MTIKWQKYQNVLIPNVSPHCEINVSYEEIKKLIKKENAYFARWVSKWDIEKSCFWYVIKDEKEDINNYKSKIRNQIKKGLKNCKVEKISKKFLIENGYEVYMKALKRYKGNVVLLNKDEFVKNIIYSNKNMEYFGVFYKELLIGFSINKITQNVCEYLNVKFDPEYLRYYSSYALFYIMNLYYLNERNFWYVSDGAKNLSHQTNIQDFLIHKFKFRRTYCKLEVVYRKDIEVLVNLLFPFRKLVYRIDNNIFQKLAVLLKHEEIRRGIC